MATGTVVTCMGCGREINLQREEQYKQNNGREVYCRACNKQYYRYQDATREINRKYDDLRRNECRGIREKIFGTKEQSEAKRQAEIRGIPTGKPQPDMSAINAVRAAAGGQSARSGKVDIVEGSGEIREDEFGPNLSGVEGSDAGKDE